MTTAQEAALLDEVLFWYFAHGDQNAEQADATLDATVRRVARSLGLQPTEADVRACAALAYEQLAAR